MPTSVGIINNLLKLLGLTNRPGDYPAHKSFGDHTNKDLGNKTFSVQCSQRGCHKKAHADGIKGAEYKPDYSPAFKSAYPCPTGID